MKILISGVVDIDIEQMDKAMAGAKPLIVGALTQDGCMDYDWCPDPVNPGRIRVFERWESEASLVNHFNNHWYTDMRAHIGGCGIKSADVLKYRIDVAEPVYDETGTPRADFFSQS
jgi:quinol monooxygenase YgiN